MLRDHLTSLDQVTIGQKNPIYAVQNHAGQKLTAYDAERHGARTDSLRILDPFRACSTLVGRLALRVRNGGGGRDRTDDLKLAKLALSQLSYAPGFHGAQSWIMVGPGGFEPPTPRLSSVCSNQLSY